MAIAEGVRVVWRAVGANFRVLRKMETGEYAMVADISSPEWLDTGTEYGKRYTYVVQTIVKLEDNKVAESELSEEFAITPEDTFAPAVPTGLRADVVTASIELAWDRNTARDLAGYRIYRAIGDAPLEKVAEHLVPQLTPDGTDVTVPRPAPVLVTVRA